MNRFNPAVPKSLLLVLAGGVWIIVGCFLLSLAFSWLSAARGINLPLFVIPGFLAGLLIHHFGFLKIVDKNLKRILSMKDKSCLFSFIPWKSYLIIGIMITMGSFLRHSDIPKHYLSPLYEAIGIALILSSLRYLRVFFGKRK